MVCGRRFSVYPEKWDCVKPTKWSETKHSIGSRNCTWRSAMTAGSNSFHPPLTRNVAVQSEAAHTCEWFLLAKHGTACGWNPASWQSSLPCFTQWVHHGYSFMIVPAILHTPSSSHALPTESCTRPLCPLVRTNPTTTRRKRQLWPETRDNRSETIELALLWLITVTPCRSSLTCIIRFLLTAYQLRSYLRWAVWPLVPLHRL